MKYWLTRPAKIVFRWTDGPNMTKAVDWDVKHQTKQTNFICIMDACKQVFRKQCKPDEFLQQVAFYQGLHCMLR